MKILQISSAQSLGGGERHLVDLINGLVGRGHEVYAAIRPGSPLNDELAKLPPNNLIKLPLRNALDAGSARELSKLVQAKQIEMVHAHMARDYPLAAYAAGRNPIARLIVTRHVLFPLNRLHRLTLLRAARIIAVSRAVATQIRADKIAAEAKISVVHNGVDTQKFVKARKKFNRVEFFRSWGLPENSLLVGTVGELSPLKGQREFLFAAAEVLKEFPNTFFIIAGIDHSPDQRNLLAYQQLIRQLGVGQRVKLVGWCEDLAELYCGLDVFVSASHTESFGLAIAEAMASGTAVVSTETAGALEIVETGRTGLLVPIGNSAKLAESILEMLRDESLRLRLGTAAREMVATQFSSERMIEETEAIYLQALKPNKVGR